MDIKTEFNIEDKVHPIQSRREKIYTPCKTCKDSGKVTIKESEEPINCPDCNGRAGQYHFSDRIEWFTLPSSKIGKVVVEITAKRFLENDKKHRERDVRYMLESTGVGSGTLWNEQDLFASKEEATNECVRRNEEQIQEGEQFYVE